MARKAATAENSVNFALRELMGMEDDRQRREEEAARRRADEGRRRREAEELSRREEAELRRRGQEQARLAAERAARAHEARKVMDDEERRLEIRLETEARVRADEQERLLRHEEELRRIDAGKAGIPRWSLGVAAGVLVLGLGGGLGWYHGRVVPEREAEERSLQIEKEEQARRTAEMVQTLAVLQADLAAAIEDQARAEKRYEAALAAGNAAAAVAAKADLEQAGKRQKLAGEKVKQGVRGGPTEQATEELDDDPMSDRLRL
jgi:hypothetical protein